MKKTKMSPFLLAALSGVIPRRLIKAQQRIEEAEIFYGKDLVDHAAKLAQETPHTIFYWIDQLEDKELK